MAPVLSFVVISVTHAQRAALAGNEAGQGRKVHQLAVHRHFVGKPARLQKFGRLPAVSARNRLNLHFSFLPAPGIFRKGAPADSAGPRKSMTNPINGFQLVPNFTAFSTIRIKVLDKIQNACYTGAQQNTANAKTGQKPRSLSSQKAAV
jgi:hypothetical protein